MELIAGANTTLFCPDRTRWIRRSARLAFGKWAVPVDVTVSSFTRECSKRSWPIGHDPTVAQQPGRGICEREAAMPGRMAGRDIALDCCRAVADSFVPSRV